MLTEVMMVTKAMMIMKARAGEGSNEMAETEWEKENILQLFSLMRVLGYVSSCPRPEARRSERVNTQPGTHRKA